MPMSQMPLGYRHPARKAVKSLNFFADQPSDTNADTSKPKAPPYVQQGPLSRPVPKKTVSPASAEGPLRAPPSIQIICDKTSILFHVPFERKSEWETRLRSAPWFSWVDQTGCQNLRLLLQFPADTAYAMQTHTGNNCTTHMWWERSPYHGQTSAPRLAMAPVKDIKGYTYLEGTQNVICTCLNFFKNCCSSDKFGQYEQVYKSAVSQSNPSITLTCKLSKKKTGVNYRIALSDCWKGPFPEDWELSPSTHAYMMIALQALQASR